MTESTILSFGSMPEFFVISDRSRVAQSLSLCRQMREMSYCGRIGILLLEGVGRNSFECFSRYDVEIKIDEKLCLKGVNRSALKMWIPNYFESEYYVLIDSDHILLKQSFFSAVKPSQNRVSLIRETDVVWQERFKGLGATHYSIIGKPMLQTGLISLSRLSWEEIFQEVKQLILNDPSEYGDQVALNQFFYSNSDLLQSLPEETSLVLRPSGKGWSTRAHLRHLMWNSDSPTYRGRPVLSIHYTNSGGQVYTLEDLQSVKTKVTV